MTKQDLQKMIGVTQDGAFGPKSAEALMRYLSNKSAAPIADADYRRVAAELGVSESILRAVKSVEAPRGAFDEHGRPSILYEKHVFGRETNYRFNSSHPDLSSRSWQPGTYGAFSAQYTKLARACNLDPDAAFKACSWGAFQILGSNAVSLGYKSAFDMAVELTKNELNHLDSFIRFVKKNGLLDELRACRPGDAESCVAFVSKYNGPGFRRNNYHINLAREAAKWMR